MSFGCDGFRRARPLLAGKFTLNLRKVGLNCTGRRLRVGYVWAWRLHFEVWSWRGLALALQRRLDTLAAVGRGKDVAQAGSSEDILGVLGIALDLVAQAMDGLP